MEWRGEFALAMESWPQTVFRERVKSLAEAGASCAWIKQLLPAALSSPVASVLFTSLRLRVKYSFVLGLHIPKFM